MKRPTLTLVVLIGAVCFAAFPMIASVMIVWLIPGIGTARTGTSGWSALHFLWMYPLLYLAILVLERFGARALPRSPLQRNALEGVGMLVVLTAMFLVFFESVVGALVAAAGAVLLYVATRPITQAMERRAESMTDGEATG